MADLAFAPQHNMVEKTEEPLNDVYVPPTLTKKVSSNMIRKSEKKFRNSHFIICKYVGTISSDGREGDSLVRAGTTASLDAQQDSSNIAKTQSKATLNESNPQGEGSGNTLGSREDGMEHAIKLMNHVPKIPHDSPLSGGHTPGSDEGSMTLKELMDLYITLSQKVLDLEKVKTAQAKEIAYLKKRVTKLEQRQSSRILGEEEFEVTTLQDIDDLVDEGMNFVLDEDAKKIEEFNLDADTEVIVEDKGSGEKRGNTAETVSTARPDISAGRPEVSIVKPKTPPTTTTLFDNKDVTIVDTLEKMMSQKAKEKGVQEQMGDDHELATRLIHEEQEKCTVKEWSKLLAEFFDKRKKQLTKERAKAIRSKPPIKTQLRNLMVTYLKHTGRFTHARIKSRSFEEIQKLYTKEQKWVDTFIPIGSEKDEKRVRSRKKRAAGSSSKQKSPKKQKVNDQESVDNDKELKKCLKVVLDDDKAINYETLDVKSLIVDCESQVLGTIEADVLDLHKIVMERFSTNDPEGYDLILWVDIKTLIKSNEDDEIWRNQQDWKLLSWKMYETCGVYTLILDDSLVSINMFVEKRLKKSKVFGYILLVIIKLILKKLDFHQVKIKFRGGLLGFMLFRLSTVS
nr:hypothetical protein [Tanacetum cinerariifolium]